MRALRACGTALAPAGVARWRDPSSGKELLDRAAQDPGQMVQRFGHRAPDVHRMRLMCALDVDREPHEIFFREFRQELELLGRAAQELRQLLHRTYASTLLMTSSLMGLV